MYRGRLHHEKDHLVSLRAAADGFRIFLGESGWDNGYRNHGGYIDNNGNDATDYDPTDYNDDYTTDNYNPTDYDYHLSDNNLCGLGSCCL